jgi:MFS family permease
VLLADREVRAICAFIVIAAALLGLLEPTFPLHLSAQFGASPTLIGGLFAVATIAYGAAAPLVGWAADRLGAAAPMRFGWVLASVLLPAIVLPRDLLLETVTVGALGIALSIALTPTLRALASAVDRVGGDYGIAYAAYNAAYAVGLMAGACAGGYAVDWLGVPRAFAVIACGALVAGVGPAIATRGGGARARP